MDEKKSKVRSQNSKVRSQKLEEGTIDVNTQFHFQLENIITFENMTVRFRLILFTSCFLITFQSCDRNDDEMPEGRYGYMLSANITIILNPNQERLDSNANPSAVPLGHGAQTVSYDKLMFASLELMDDYTSRAVNQQSYSVIPFYIGENGGYLNGTFHHGGSSFTAKYLRLHLLYQNIKVNCKVNGSIQAATGLTFLSDHYNPYESIYIGDSLLGSDSTFNQGQWFLRFDYQGTDTIIQGQTTTLTEPNYLYSSKPNTSDKSCTIICPINPPITIHKNDAPFFTVSISSNQAFEWIEHSDPAYFEPLDGDTLFDFGLRGVKVIY